MASIRREVVIDVAPEQAWSVIGDFASGPLRMAPGFVADCRLEEPGLRAVTFADGQVVYERLVGLDAANHRLVYSVVDGAVRPIHDNAVFEIHPEVGGRSRFVWIRDVLPDELAAPMAAAMDAGLEVVRHTLESRPAST